MNQILITQKLYVTPELKRKKKLYRIEFFLSVFLLCILFSYYIYAEYDRNKSEEVSQDILANLSIGEDIPPDDTEMDNDGPLLIILKDQQETTQEVVEEQPAEEQPSTEVYTSKSGQQYSIIGRIQIPKIGVDYPIFSECTVELLRKAPNKFWGANPNEVGNCCIAGHNYRNNRFFSKVPTLENGDIIEITDVSKRKIKYRVYSKTVVGPKDKSGTSQLTDGKREVTLVTCTDDSSERYVIKATEVL